ncbi:DUF6188 family protein [Glycomyces tenuis]|uniref:DUF6188 family protein n=1 Tax=Glycomyces tenuis TaxID=58116 RepID=UPI00068666BC|nr:DUF6188 family protein [Glycomyces tenuis]
MDGQIIARVSEQFPLILYTSEKWSITVESALTFTDAGDDTRRFKGDAPEDVTALGPLLQGLTFREATVEDGSLRLAFTNGAELIAPPDPHYESWGVTGPAGQRIISMPGGELAIWAAEEPDR